MQPPCHLPQVPTADWNASSMILSGFHASCCLELCSGFLQQSGTFCKVVPVTQLPSPLLQRVLDNAASMSCCCWLCGVCIVAVTLPVVSQSERLQNCNLSTDIPASSALLFSAEIHVLKFFVFLSSAKPVRASLGPQQL